MKTRQVWFIHASTGCSCCREDNFMQGPFLSEESAKGVADYYHATKRLSSQYSETGRYHIEAIECEELPDGRFINGPEVWGPEIEERQE